MPLDRLIHPRLCKAHRRVRPPKPREDDAAIAASLRAAENEGWPPARPAGILPARRCWPPGPATAGG